jgi:hypothetical protein
MTLAIAPGTRVVVRDEEWLVRNVRETKSDGLRVEVTGISDLVRDQDAVFFEELDAKAEKSESKLDELVSLLDRIGVGAGSPVRAVVFSERIATLRWLRTELPARLGLDPGAIAMLRGSLPDWPAGRAAPFTGPLRPLRHYPRCYWPVTGIYPELPPTSSRTNKWNGSNIPFAIR